MNFYCRKLIGPNTKSEAFRAQLWHEAEKVIGSSYNPSFSSMSKSLLSSYIAHGQDDFIQHTIKSRIERVESDVNAILNSLENSVTIQKTIIKKLLSLRLDQLKMAKESVTIIDKNEVNIDDNNANLKVKTYYCSQLVAEILTTTGVLSPYSGRADKVAYIPGDFSGSTLLPCVNLTSGSLISHVFMCLDICTCKICMHIYMSILLFSFGGESVSRYHCRSFLLLTNIFTITC